MLASMLKPKIIKGLSYKVTSSFFIYTEFNTIYGWQYQQKKNIAPFFPL